MEKAALHVLLVEDNLADVRLLREALAQDARADFDLTVAESLAEAQAQLARRLFDAAVLDLNLPDRRGLATFLELHQAAPDLPVVVLSALADEDVARQALQAGAQDYLAKHPPEILSAGRAVRYAVERHRRQAAVRESEARLKGFLEAAPDALVIVNRDRKIILANTQAEKLFGYAHRELLQADLERLIPERAKDTHADLVTHFFQQPERHGQGQGRELVARHKDGHEIAVEISLSHHQLDAEPVVLCALRDITARKQAEAKLRASEVNLAEAQRVAKLGSWRFDIASNTVSWSDELYAIFDVEKAAFGEMYESFLSRVYAADKPLVLETNRKARETGAPFQVEYRITTRSGRLKHIHEEGYAVRDAQGAVAGLFGIAQDITERRLAEAARARLAERLDLATRSARIGIWDWDIQKNEIIWDDQMYALYGLRPGEFGGAYEAWLNGIYPADRQSSDAVSAAAVRGEREYDTEFRVQWPDGSVHWLKANGRIFRDEHGAPLRMVGVNYDITERKQADQALREREEMFRTLFDNSPIGIELYDRNCIVRNANRRVADLFGLDLNAVLGVFNLRDDPNYQYADVWERLQRGEEVRHEIEFDFSRTPYATRRAGRARYQIITTPIPEAVSREIGYLMQIVDITEQERARQALEQKQAHLQAILDYSPALISIKDLSGNIILANAGFAALDAPPLNEFVGRNVFEVFPAEVAQALWDNDRAALAAGGPVYAEETVRHKDGRWHTYLTVKFPVYQTPGQPFGVCAISSDITERQQAEQALKESEARFSTAFFINPAPQSILSLASGRVEEVNAATCQLYGYSRAELIGADPGTLNLWYDPAERLAALQELQASGRLLPRVVTIRRKSGERRSILFAAEPIAWRGEPSLITSSLDITERQQAEQELQELNRTLGQRIQRATAELQDLYDHAPAGYHSLDAEGRIVMVNQTELDWLGYARAELIGQPFARLFTPASLTLFQANFPLFKQRGWVHSLEFDLLRKDGTTFPVLVSATAITDEAGRYVMSRSTVFDNTERKQAERMLRESAAQLRVSRDQMSAANAALEKAAHLKDEFLASMSHELRTPLTGILGLAEALQLDTYGALNEKQRKALQGIEDSGRHLLSLINDILDLSKVEAGMLQLDLALLSVAEVCRASLQLTQGMAHKKRLTVDFSIKPDTLRLRADARRLKQMLVNLLSNAIKFTPEGGAVGLDVRADQPARVVQLTVWDKGMGIASENLERLFQPFVQLDSGLARQYEGSGLGLPLVQRMAELHGGSLQVESTLGEGSRFTIRLPWSPAGPEAAAGRPGQAAPAPELAEAAPARAAGAGQPCLLVVDDNERTLEVLTDFLVAGQFQVVQAGNGLEALDQAVRRHPDLIVMDIQMPGLDGLETIRRLRAHADLRAAHTPIIALTALATAGDRDRCLAAGANEYLSKPVGLPQLAEAIRALLGGRPLPEA